MVSYYEIISLSCQEPITSWAPDRVDLILRGWTTIYSLFLLAFGMDDLRIICMLKKKIKCKHIITENLNAKLLLMNKVIKTHI